MASILEARQLIKLPPVLIKALGEVSARYGQIEHLLTMTIHRTGQLSYNDAVAEVERLKRRKKVNRQAKQCFNAWAINNFGEINGKERAAAFDRLIQEWADLTERRDNVIHCCWSVGCDDNQLTGTRRGKLLTRDGRPFGIKDVKLLGIDLKQFVFQLNRATEPTWVSGPESEIAEIPDRFVPGYVIPAGLETTATAAALLTTTEQLTAPSDD